LICCGGDASILIEPFRQARTLSQYQAAGGRSWIIKQRRQGMVRQWQERLFYGTAIPLLKMVAGSA